MIKKIARLSKFGNYRSFRWGSNTAFSKRNLIYGWNYSGKTTLSRLFQIIEDPSQIIHWIGCRFEVELQNGDRLTETNILNQPRVKVFNRDFIQRNFAQDHKAPAVFIVGVDAIRLRDRIVRLNEHEGKVTDLKIQLDEDHQLLRKELDLLGTSQASSIAHITGDKTYNRTKLTAEIDRIKGVPESYILSDETLQAKVSLVRSTQEWLRISPVQTITTDVGVLHQGLSNVAQKTASNEAISRLHENRGLESWVRAGLSHHTTTEKCEFCGSKIPAERLAILGRHFSKSYEDLTSEVAEKIAELENSTFSITLPDERDFMPDLKSEFITLKNSIENWVIWVNAIIEELSGYAKQKQLQLETSLTCLVDTSRASEGNQIIKNINALIERHNQACAKIGEEKKSAKAAIEKHYASEFYRKNKISDKEDSLQSSKSKIEKAQGVLSRIADKRDEIEAQIQQQSIGALKINETLQFLLPDNCISVAEIEGGSFEFRRDSLPANNLSEGEKTAITFAYFLATLENNGASLNQAIVFIDDPISSLDSNHIYAVYALITRRLDSCLQLFVSTHNSELYTLLKDCWFNVRDQFSNHRDASSYLTRRYLDSTTQQWNSTIEDAPALLRRYKSEYQFVYEQLHHFSTSQSPTLHEAYTAPNLLRKFLEAYLGFKKPCVPKWSDKLDLLFDSEVEQAEIQKFSDDASHLQGLNRALARPDFISTSQITVRKVIQALKAKDLSHYTSMCTVIGVTP